LPWARGTGDVGSVAKIGDEREASAASAVLEVPSAVIPSESNYLVNVQHRDFRAIMLGKVRDFRFDPRLKGETTK